VVSNLGCPLMTCNWLTLDDDGYIAGYKLRHELGKVDAISQFQRLGFRVLAVGDSYNDLAMLEAADAGLLFRPSSRLTLGGSEFPTVLGFAELQAELQKASSEDV